MDFGSLFGCYLEPIGWLFAAYSESKSEMDFFIDLALDLGAYLDAIWCLFGIYLQTMWSLRLNCVVYCSTGAIAVFCRLEQ